MILLGFDIGSSSVKASLVEAESGQCIASAFYPKQEAPILSHRAGWAEQEPEKWWEYAQTAFKEAVSKLPSGQNGGGSLDYAYRLAATFIDHDTLVGYWQHKRGTGHNDFSELAPLYVRTEDMCNKWLRPTIVLQDRHAYSATNSFVSAMRYICLADMGKVFSFALSDENMSTLCRITEKYLLSRIDGRLTTLEFYKSII